MKLFIESISESIHLPIIVQMLRTLRQERASQHLAWFCLQSSRGAFKQGSKLPIVLDQVITRRMSRTRPLDSLHAKHAGLTTSCWECRDNDVKGFLYVHHKVHSINCRTCKGWAQKGTRCLSTTVLPTTGSSHKNWRHTTSQVTIRTDGGGCKQSR